MLDFSDKRRLAKLLHPGKDYEEVQDQFEEWLAEHELHGLAMTVVCPCGDVEKNFTIREVLDADEAPKPHCKCTESQWFDMKCSHCGHEHAVPEHKVETAKCPECQD